MKEYDVTPIFAAMTIFIVAVFVTMLVVHIFTR